jgi:folate-binding protein YgfZ
MTEHLFCLPLNRGLLGIQGEGVKDFLQGIITQDVQNIQTLSYGLLLSPQGRYLYDFFIWPWENGFILDTSPESLDPLRRILKTYGLRKKFNFVDLSEDQEVWVLINGESPLEGFHGDPRLPSLGYRWLGKRESLSRNILGTEKDYHRYLTTLGIPQHGIHMITDKSIALECNIDMLHGISWTKGCYIGQELMARTYHRGVVRKRLCPFSWSGTTPEIGQEIFYEDEKIGKILSLEDSYGMGMMNIEKSQRWFLGQKKALTGDPYIHDLEQSTLRNFPCSFLQSIIPSWLKEKLILG